MTGWLKLTDAQRKTSIDQAALESGISAKAIEKDWWVTLTLKALYSSPYADHLIFKGGTSLSKCWKLIERFSEDIDIALDPAVVGMPYEDEPTRSYLVRLKKRGCEFTTVPLKEALEKQFIALGVPEGMINVEAEEIAPTMTDKDPQSLFVHYKSLYEKNAYLADVVKIEVGIRSKLEPFSKVAIQSMLNEIYPNEAYHEEPFEVQAVEPHKTFLEKTFLLHEEFKKPDRGRIRTERMSRHFYDLGKMMDTPTCEKALADMTFYTAIVSHRSRYNTIKTLDYSSLMPASIDFILPEDLKEFYHSDYITMRKEMIYGASLEPAELFEKIRVLKDMFRKIG